MSPRTPHYNPGPRIPGNYPHRVPPPPDWDPGYGTLPSNYSQGPFPTTFNSPPISQPPSQLQAPPHRPTRHNDRCPPPQFASNLYPPDVSDFSSYDVLNHFQTYPSDPLFDNGYGSPPMHFDPNMASPSSHVPRQDVATPAVVRASQGRRKDKGPQRHICVVCRRDFTRKSNLEAHYLAHTDERPEVCSQDCGRAFRTRSDRIRHEKHFRH
ncbi:hypothetical protein JAAARDRAFT_133530 [Jaapia argillacea MUCL 33604]|uniref:C2H2-type domain-containing protein n=1 Tax=Jaapia argillacea MUCL 33604 TaxID=933084 RepID=A0A067PZ53_9AGAM|nr:hypothetical protein JAAARDRAFT_133530 [Jaapia argillacea MUCL 33604]